MGKLILPDIIFVGGKKRSGKDFVCDRLVEEAGFTKVHIVEPWLRQWATRYGYADDDWVRAKTELREQCQIDATAEREKDPFVLINWLRESLPTLPRPLCVTAVRFTNETLFGMQIGALCLKVETPDTERAKRFLASGDSLALLNDPFESQIDVMPVHAVIPGTMPADWYVPAISAIYSSMLGYKDQMRKAA